MNRSSASQTNPSGPGWFFSGLSEMEVFQIGYSVGWIFNRAARNLGVTPQELTGPGRQSHLVAARHVAVMTLQQRHPDLHLEELGALLGLKRDRTRYAFHHAVIRITYKDRLYLHA